MSGDIVMQSSNLEIFY